MEKFLKVLGFIIIFIIGGIIKTVSKNHAETSAYKEHISSSYSTTTSTTSSDYISEKNTDFIKQAENYAQNNKKKMVDNFVHGVKILGLPRKVDDFTILKNVYSSELNTDTFVINHIYDLTIQPEQIYLIDDTFQQNMLNNFLNSTCSQSSFQFFNKVKDITLYYRYFLDKHELLTMTIPSGTCTNRSLAKIHFNPLPVTYQNVEESSKPEATQAIINSNDSELNTEDMQAELEQHNNQCRQIAKNIGYYFTYAAYCDVEAQREESSFDVQLREQGCNLSVQEIQSLSQEAQIHFEQSAEQADDYDKFCKKELSYWQRINNYPN